MNRGHRMNNQIPSDLKNCRGLHEDFSFYHPDKRVSNHEEIMNEPWDYAIVALGRIGEVRDIDNAPDYAIRIRENKPVRHIWEQVQSMVSYDSFIGFKELVMWYDIIKARYERS